MEDTIFVDGFFVNEPHEKAPDFINQEYAWHKETFMAWLESQEVDDKGYVRAQNKTAQTGNKYNALKKPWKPQTTETKRVAEKKETTSDGLPF